MIYMCIFETWLLESVYCRSGQLQENGIGCNNITQTPDGTKKVWNDVNGLIGLSFSNGFVFSCMNLGVSPSVVLQTVVLINGLTNTYLISFLRSVEVLGGKKPGGNGCGKK